MSRSRRLISAAGAVTVVLACAAGLLALGPDDQAPATPAVSATHPGSAADTARRAVQQYPKAPYAWAQLARAEIEQARTTLDADRLETAEQALRRSLDLDATDNYAAVTGQGLLANARHEFVRGREFALRATRMAPDRAEGYGVLADAEIQLGRYPQARNAVQRMLDLAPSTASYSRAAYDLETHGRKRDAEIALGRAEQASSTPDEKAYTAYRLGELAWSDGDVTRAEHHFRRALATVPGHPYAESGLARVEAAHRRGGAALQRYGRLVERTPTPQFLLEALELTLATAPTGQDSSTGPLRAALDAQLRLARAGNGPVDPHLALYAADHGDPQVAVELMRREAKNSNSVIVADALGWALFRAGRLAEAAEQARSAARTGWDHALFLYHRGVIETALGLPDGHRRVRRALEVNPHFSPYHCQRAQKLLGGEDMSTSTGN
ncbi:tetratricopeptide repeat protein [Streptomyces sp. H27-S2]|uniref:tetratricopeptide repeat protein n=1 Tax=Streptomyces antarcticus TaxID=2996458 RepID=UPI00226F63E1|nr:tetratricopeptide repeat protein [Streptomyces sp. H27-S2]MCY0950455.1 tetratricopeptide repeat protein [Streptomyces sp. H27-S2]